MRGKAESNHFSSIFDRKGLDRDDRLVEDPSKVAVVPPEGKDKVGAVLVSQCNSRVGPEAPDDLLKGYSPFKAEIEIDHMHVLCVELDC